MDIKSEAKAAFDAYDLTKYEGTSQLSVLDWRAILWLRRSVWWGMNAEVDDFYGARAELIRRIRDAPLSTLRMGSRTYEPACVDLTVQEAWSLKETVLSHLPKFIAPLTRLSEIDSERTEKSLESASDGEIDDLIKAVKEERELIDEVSSSFSRELFETNIYDPMHYVAVDITAPDEVILEHFKGWLEQYRSEYGKVDRVSDSDLRKWAHHRVLQYIDLKILSKLACIQPTNFQLGSKIFSDLKDIDVAEKIRKTTAPTGDWLLGDGGDTLDSVANAAQLRLIGKNWGSDSFR